MRWRVPVGMAMGLVGVSGLAYLTSGGPALKIVGHTTMRTVTDFNFAVVPMFLLMGSFATTSGMSRELFRAANAFLGLRAGGFAFAPTAAGGAFLASSGWWAPPAPTFSKAPNREFDALTIRSPSRTGG